MDDTAETPLTGGRVTPGVVRIGDTVRRPITGDGPLRHDLLRHLEEAGFAGAPRFLGIDGEGREILSFLPGAVPTDLGAFGAAQIVAAARLLRSFHDAAADFAGSHSGRAETICHNDFAPTNAVFREGLPVAMIDFDAARPGLRLWDLGYTAFTWLDLGNADHAADEQIDRLRLLAEAYGTDRSSAEAIAAFALARQTALAVLAGERGQEAMARWALDAAAWTAEHVVARLLPAG